MKKLINIRMILIVLPLIPVFLLSACVVIQIPKIPQVPIASQTLRATEAVPTPSHTLSVPSVSPTAALEASYLLENVDPAPGEEKCAEIVGLSMRMDGQTDVIFDYVDWLSGDQATEQYLIDHQGATEEDMEIDGLYEIGYIRNASTEKHTFHTAAQTKYYLPREDDIAMNAQVSYDEFRDIMFPAVIGGVDSYLTFVKFSISGDSIAKIEYLYTP